MKFILNLILGFLFVVFPACSQVKEVKSEAKQLPKPVGYVNDFAQLFTVKEESTLDSLITAIEKRTTIEIAVVTVVDSMASQEEFDSYTLQLSNNWGVGKKDKNNGILIGISTSLKSIRIQNGYGIEEVLSDSETKEVIENFMIPEFRKGSYFAGTKNGILDLVRKLE